MIAPERKEALYELRSGAQEHLLARLKKQSRRFRKRLKKRHRIFPAKAVHDSRVAARRLLSVLELLEPFMRGECVRKARRLLKSHLDRFDKLRDAQVHLHALETLVQNLPSARVFQRYLYRREKRLARKAITKLKRLKTGKLTHAIDDCVHSTVSLRKEAMQQRANVILLRAIGKAFSRANQLREHIVPSQAQTIHRTRIAFKRFRYMLESLAKCLPAVNEQFLEALRHYQTMMGDVQDAETLLCAFRKFQEKKGLGGLQDLQAELERRRQWLIQIYLDAAGQMADFWPEPQIRSKQK